MEDFSNTPPLPSNADRAALGQIFGLIGSVHIPIKEFIDHGADIQPGANIDPVLQRYAELYAKAKHTVTKPGDKIPVGGLRHGKFVGCTCLPLVGLEAQNINRKGDSPLDHLPAGFRLILR
jgi:hypothetical protein